MIRARMELGERVSAAVEDNASSHDVKTVALLCLKAGQAELDEEVKGTAEK